MNKTLEQRWAKDHYRTSYPRSQSGYLLKDGFYIDLVSKEDVDPNFSLTSRCLRVKK